MTTSYDKQKKTHYDLLNVGLRAQATAVGMVQIAIELRRANVLDEEAIDRIKNAIADEVSLNAPRSMGIQDYRLEIMTRLDRLFAGEEEVGATSPLSFETAEGHTAQ
jgi:hypothetical protein